MCISSAYQSISFSLYLSHQIITFFLNLIQRMPRLFLSLTCLCNGLRTFLQQNIKVSHQSVKCLLQCLVPVVLSLSCESGHNFMVNLSMFNFLIPKNYVDVNIGIKRFLLQTAINQ